MKKIIDFLLRMVIALSAFALLIYTFELMGGPVEGCLRKDLKGSYKPRRYSKGQTHFSLSGKLDTIFTIGFDAAANTEERDFYNYAEEGDSLYKDNDTMYLYKPNGNTTKWLLNCGYGIPGALPGFGVPNAEKWREELKEKGLWKW